MSSLTRMCIVNNSDPAIRLAQGSPKSADTYASLADAYMRFGNFGQGEWCGFEEGVMADAKSVAKLKASLLREFHLP